MKTCTKCKAIKSLEDFYFRQGKPISACKVCTVSKVADYSQTNHGRYVRAMSEAKFRGKTWDISKEKYIKLINQICSYCEGLLDPTNSKGIGLDRINNAIGYQLNNVVRSCAFCNYLKGDILTSEETQALVELLISMRKLKKHEAA